MQNVRGYMRRGDGMKGVLKRTYSTMKTVLQLICAPKSFTCSSPSCRLAPSTVLSSVSSARGFLSPLTVIFCRLGENYSSRLIKYCYRANFFKYERTFGNFVVMTALTSPMVASGLTSIVKGKLRANAGGFAAADIVNVTILNFKSRR